MKQAHLTLQLGRCAAAAQSANAFNAQPDGRKQQERARTQVYRRT